VPTPRWSLAARRAGERSSDVHEFTASGLDLVAGVGDGVGEFDGGPRGDAVVEPAVSEDRAEMIHDAVKVRHPGEVAVESAGAVKGGRDLGTFEAVKQDGQAGEREGRVADVAGAVQGVDGRLEQDEGLTRVAVDGFDTGGFFADDRFPLHKAVIASDDERFTQSVERTRRIGVSEGPPERTERAGDEEGVAVGAGGGHRRLGERQGLVDPPDDGQKEDLPYQTGDVRQPRLSDEAGDDFQRLAELSGVEIGGRLHQPLSPGSKGS
jgi:hypothetical protein